MSSDQRAVAAAHRQGRRWRHGPWGWWALATSIAAWACMVGVVFLFAASIGMPGDGDHAMQATRLPMRITLTMATIAAVGSLATGSARCGWVASLVRRSPR